MGMTIKIKMSTDENQLNENKAVVNRR